MTDKQSIEFQNDIAELESAVAFYKNIREWASTLEHNEVNPEAEHAVDAIITHVPKLIKAYEDLFALSMSLTDAWDAANLNKTPAGLEVVPSLRLTQPR